MSMIFQWQDISTIQDFDNWLYEMTDTSRYMYEINYIAS